MTVHFNKRTELIDYVTEAYKKVEQNLLLLSIALINSSGY